MPTDHPPLPAPGEQAERLIELGVAALCGLSAVEVRARVRDLGAENALLVIHPARVAPSRLAPLLRHGGRPGFVVTDLAEVDDFAPIEGAEPPSTPLYLLHDLVRGDHLANWSPDEALPAITAAGRTPLTLAEGIHWVLQQPEILARNHCWAGNRHAWLGFASAAGRSPLPEPQA